MNKIGEENIWKFFGWSEYLDYEVTKQLGHIRPNWELTWLQDKEKYLEESDSFAKDINILVSELGNIETSKNYHKYEDKIGEFTNKFLKWGIEKKGKRWGINDYAVFLEQGAFNDYDQQFLKNAAVGRINVAIKRGQLTYDEMEESHRIMLGDLLAVILYHVNNEI